MLLNLFQNNVWLAIGLWAGLSILDYVLTLKAAHIYRDGASKHFIYPGGIELNPYFKEDVARLRRFSFRFILHLFFIGGFLLIAHSLGFPRLFAFVWGMFVWLLIAVHFRHIRNLMVFHYAGKSAGVSGQIEYQPWLILRLSSVEFFCFAALSLFLFLFSGSFFMLGGAIGCLSLAVRHLIDSFRAKHDNSLEDVVPGGS